jgi:hypothetical protein
MRGDVIVELDGKKILDPAELPRMVAFGHIGKIVTLTGATLGGADAGNYVLSPAAITTTASITAKAITGSFTAADKIYDGTTAGVAGTGSRESSLVI